MSVQKVYRPQFLMEPAKGPGADVCDDLGEPPEVIPSTPEAVPDTIMSRNNNGRSQVEAPVDPLDAANKGYVDGAIEIVDESIEAINQAIAAGLSPYEILNLSSTWVSDGYRWVFEDEGACLAWGVNNTYWKESFFGPTTAAASPGTPNNLMCMRNANTAIAITANNTLSYTVNRGSSWSSVTLSGLSYNTSSAIDIDDTVGVVASSSAATQIYTCGSQVNTWTARTLPSGTYRAAVGGGYVYAIANNTNQVHRWDPSGVQVTFTLPASAHYLAASASAVVVYSTASRLLYVSTDLGETWQERAVTFGAVNGGFRVSGDVILVQANNIGPSAYLTFAASFDFGQTWTIIHPPLLPATTARLLWAPKSAKIFPIFSEYLSLDTGTAGTTSRTYSSCAIKFK